MKVTASEDYDCNQAHNAKNGMQSVYTVASASARWEAQRSHREQHLCMAPGLASRG